ncbi:outer membrane beta-barrel protein [Sphingomonas sp. HITSZ_GF]|uniref:outer membrane protein n=1 Tax=Sphingomonas sp. HITSZ_GF TaxID=3037247 RepID=UPI00240E396B|nr:outer membrane beta-barrel protein [Sphingomonas sp. HITSZ_GF]MDG2533127.1 outer membrane beta-barrel protein [Sphingomonas sp. HITSZ_GF]
MRTSIMLIAAAAASLLGATTAFAQEGTTTTETASDAGAARKKAFTGLRAEATIGFDQSDANAVGDNLPGMRVGGAVGYDLAIGKTFTIGAEAGIGWNVLGNTSLGYLHPDGEVINYRASAAHDIDVSLRIGAKIDRKTLAYVKAGWADAAYRYQFSTPDWGTQYGHNDDGIRVGAGIEHMLTKRVYAKAEYRFTKYDDIADSNRHQLLTGVGVRF